MGQIKYILHPGWVTSVTDGDRHFIGARELADLHGVNLLECMAAPAGWSIRTKYLPGGAKHLYPSVNGVYGNGRG